MARMCDLPVRFTADTPSMHDFSVLHINVEKTAVLVVDVDGDCGPACNRVVDEVLAPMLLAVRTAGMRIMYAYNDPRDGPDGPRSVYEELHFRRRGRIPPKRLPWHPSQPTWAPSIAPRPGDAQIAKCSQSAFRNTYLDRYLRAWDIDTILAAGFSFKSCLFYTIVGAFEHNYRVVLLRDGTDPEGANEFDDTVAADRPEGGWVRLVLTRLIEDHLGYSSTCEELQAACQHMSTVQP